MIKIVITGPESTGKSRLSNQLATHFNIPFVEEFAREYINNLKRNYNQSDLLEITKGQLQNENSVLLQKPNFLLSDTDLLTIKIWSEYKYKRCDEFIADSLNANLPTYYLLCKPDLEWQLDEQREHPNSREELFEIYQNEIEALNIPYYVVEGEGEKRIENALQIMSKLGF